MIQSKTVSDFMPNLLDGIGIFDILNAQNVPWRETVKATDLNRLYYAHSSQKRLSKLCEDLLALHDYDGYISYVAGMCYTLYGDKWNRIYNALTLDYDPIENYSMIETVSDTGTNERTTSDTGTVSNDTESADGGTVTESGTNGTDTGAYGFNSNTSVPTDTTDATTNNTTTRNLTGTENATETRNLTGTENSEHDYKIERKRSGNIGVTTSQQMAQSEIELRQYQFFNGVFEDLDSIITLYVW